MRLAAMLLLWPLAASAQTAKPEELATIEGRVVNGVTGEPLGKVSLILLRTGTKESGYDWDHSYGATSDAAGKFTIPNLERGKYLLRASRTGFVTLEYGARATRRSGTVLDLDPTHSVKELELRLTPQGVVTGRILDVDGEPLANVQVQFLRSRYVNGRKGFAIAMPASTNDIGEYRLAGLAPGRYYIYAEYSGPLPPGSAPREEYVPVYYPGSTDVAGAAPLEVAAGSQVRAADLMVQKARTVTVKGRVAVDLPGAEGVPTVRFSSHVGHDISGASSFRVPAAQVNRSGEFVIRSLTPGSYTVLASAAKSGVWYTGQTTVNVTGNLEGVVVTVNDGVTLAGRIRVEGEEARDLSGVTIQLRRGGPAIDSVLLGWKSRIAPDGAFRFEHFDTGRYGMLITGLPDGFYVKSMRTGDTDVLYSGIDLTSAAAGPVDVLVSPKAGTVAVTVQGEPGPGSTVVLVPQEKERVVIPGYYQDALADQYGRFTFKSVPPGEYTRCTPGKMSNRPPGWTPNS
jgi:carboxypeptidase family protein